MGIEKFHIVSCAPEERRRESLVPCVLNGSNANDASNVTFLPRKVLTRGCHENQIRYVGIATGFNLGGVIYSIVLLFRSKQCRTHSLLKVEQNDVDAIIVLIIMQFLLCCTGIHSRDLSSRRNARFLVANVSPLCNMLSGRNPICLVHQQCHCSAQSEGGILQQISAFGFIRGE